MDGSTSQRVTPARLNVLSIFDYAGHGWITIGKLKHLGAVLAIRLRVAIDEGNPF